MQTIRELQGEGLFSPLAGQSVHTLGVVTGLLRKGFYLQTPEVAWDGRGSDAIFVFGDTHQVQAGQLVEVWGECLDYQRDASARPMTQIKLQRLQLVAEQGPAIEPIELTATLLPTALSRLAEVLNSLEGMQVRIAAGATFIAPSNLFGDYVCAVEGQAGQAGTVATEHGGLVVTGAQHDQWFPGFRLRDYRAAPQLNVGSRLLSDVVGPLHYRVEAWQVAASEAFDFDPNPIVLEKSPITSANGALTVMTLNCFNLDWHVEGAARVTNPKLDIDDDWGDGRFHTLAQAVVLQANTPDIIALQEIQDNDGAELSSVTDATKTYTALALLIKQLSNVEYEWVDIAPTAGADGGQPGGNIRNGYLYNPARVDLLRESVQLIGADAPCFQDSRKPLMATFRERASRQTLTVINVHLASKREQLSIFAPQQPGHDPREAIRIEQAQTVATVAARLLAQGGEYYITGDFNDHEHSETLHTLTGGHSTNLVMTLAPEERFDYNHRGKLQVLMHGIVPNAVVQSHRASYHIVHGNELIGVEPGASTDKPSDHAYVIAGLRLA